MLQRETKVAGEKDNMKRIIQVTIGGHVLQKMWLLGQNG